MTVTLTPDPTNARVRLTADALNNASSVIVERSTNLVRWSTVRGGAAMPVAGAGLLLPGTAGNYASTPDNAALDITGDLDIRVDATPSTWSPSSPMALVAKWVEGTQHSYMLQVQAGGFLVLFFSTTGADFPGGNSTVPVVPYPGGRLAVRATLDVDNGAGGRTITFYTAPTIAGPWTQLGAPAIAGGTVTVFSGTAPLEVGTNNNGALTPFNGYIHAAQVRNGLNGTIVANPQFYAQATGATGFTDSATRVWALNGTASNAHRQIALDDYEFMPGVLNTYRVRPVTPATGLYLPATAGNYASTPDAAALDITGDLDLRIEATLEDWTPVSFSALVGKFTSTGNQRSYLLSLDTSGKLALNWSTLGTSGSTAFVLSTVAVPIASGRLAVRATLDVDNGAAGNTVTFYTAPSISGPWTQLGAPVVNGGVTSIFSSTAILEAGTADAGTSSPLAGAVHAVEVRSGIAGTVVANPDFTVQANLTTSFADTAGRTWTVNGEAFILGSPLGTASLTPTLDRIWLKSPSRPFLNRAVTVTDWSPVQRPARATDNDIVSRTLPIAVTDMGGSRRFTLELYAATHADAQTLDYIMASGDVLYLHTPPGCEVPGPLYARRDTSAERRPRPRASSRVVSFPLVECAAPGPDVAAALNTWDSILAAFPNWDAVLAAFPTWDDLLAYRGDPSEVIVP